MSPMEPTDAGHEFLQGAILDSEATAGERTMTDPDERDTRPFDCLGAEPGNGEGDDDDDDSSSSSSSSSDPRGSGHRCPGG